MNLELSRLKSRSFSALAPPTLPCAPPTATVEMDRGKGGKGAKGKGGAHRQRSNRRNRRWERVASHTALVGRVAITLLAPEGMDYDVHP